MRRLLLTLAVMAILPACTGPPVHRAGRFVLPTHSSEGSMGALLRGRLTTSDRCFFVRTETGMVLPIWPQRLSVRRAGSGYALVEDGRVVVSSGDVVDVGGGEVPTPDQGWGTPARCLEEADSIWVAGGIDRVVPSRMLRFGKLINRNGAIAVARHDGGNRLRGAVVRDVRRGHHVVNHTERREAWIVTFRCLPKWIKGPHPRLRADWRVIVDAISPGIVANGNARDCPPGRVDRSHPNKAER